jgi:hypothetical protein
VEWLFALGAVSGGSASRLDSTHAVSAVPIEPCSLPLPADVGKAIAQYLQYGRPKTTSSEVFVAAQAPLVAIGRGGVASIVRGPASERGCRRLVRTVFAIPSPARWSNGACLLRRSARSCAIGV